MNKRYPHGASERGQAMILLVLGMTVMFVIGAIAVDVGLWLSERRGSQKDADFAALAGAYQLLDPSGVAADAVYGATDALAKNNQQGNASFANPVTVDDSCFHKGEDDAVSVDIEHQSKSLFSSIFGVLQPDIGAHAKACVGASNGGGSLVPFEIDSTAPCFDSDGKPKFTELCPLEGGAHTSDPRGMLDLQADGNYCSDTAGNGAIEDLIISGAPGSCLINPGSNCDPANNGPWYNCVGVQDGNPQKVINGVNIRVSKDGACDANFGNGDGVDDFSETVVKAFDTGDPFTSIYAPRDCDPTEDGQQISPRLVTIIVLAQPPTVGGSQGYAIHAFAGFYIQGCADESIDVKANPELIDPYCGTKIVREFSPTATGDELFVSSAQPGPPLAPCGGSNQATCTPTPVPTSTPIPTPTPLPTQDKNCGKGGRPTCTPTPAPTPTLVPTPTPLPTPTPIAGSGCKGPGQCVVYGAFVNLILAGAGVGPPTDQTTIFGISLVD